MSTSAVASRSFVADVIALGKPRITFMVLITTTAGLLLAPAAVAPSVIVATLIGVALVVAGANALNMYLERDVDALMSRTKNRPLPAGRLQPEIALAFGIGCAVISVPLLAVQVNPLTGFLAALSLVLYVLAYTPLKRRSTAALMVGAIPGAMPPLLGWTAATGVLSSPGIALFLILFVWQLPHFIAISIFRVDEYQRAGLKVVPAVRGLGIARLQIGLYSLLMVAVSLQVVRAGIGGAFYLASALALGGGLVTLAAYGLGKNGDARWARWYFFYTLVYLPSLLIALALSHR